MKKSDLFREWARVIDMCEGTNVDPGDCLRIDGTPCRLKNPRFNDDPECYTFAVSILEGKPLFVGDEVYWKRAGKFDWDKWSLPDDKKMCQDMLTRTPPVRTIMLNGEKLPAPNDGCFYLYIGGFNHIQYGFKNGEDLIKVEDAINKLISGK